MEVFAKRINIFLTSFFVLACLFLFIFPGDVQAANRYWVGGSDGATTNDAANWSASDPTSCSGGGASIPTTSDLVIFDADCDNGATMDAAFSAQGIQFNSGYTGTVTQNSGITITLGGSGWTQSGGIFVGGDSNITNGCCGGNFVLNGGTFTNTSATFSFTGSTGNSSNLTVNGGTFNNPGTFSFGQAFNGTSTVTCSGTLPGYMDPSGRSTFVVSNDCTITLPSGGSTSGNITNNGTINGTTFNMSGGSTFTDNGTVNLSGSLIFNTGNNSVTQTLNCSGVFESSVDLQHTRTATVVIGTGCEANFVANVSAGGSLTVNGTVNATNIQSDNTVTINSGGNLNLTGNLTFAGGANAGSVLSCNGDTIAGIVVVAKSNFSGSALTINSNCTVGGFTYSSGSAMANPGSAVTLSITGNFSETDDSILGGSNLTIEFTGSGTQTISKTNGTFSSVLRVNKSGGSVSLSTNFSTSGQTCTVAEGTFDINNKSFSCGSTFTIEDGGTLELFGSEVPTTPVLNSGSTVVYTGDGDSAADAYALKPWTYSNLTIAMVDSNDSVSLPTAGTLATGLISYWKLDDGTGSSTASDSSGNSNTGNLQSMDSSTDWEADTPTLNVSNPYSLDFDGTDDYISTTTQYTNPSSFTISLWFKTSSASGRKMIGFENSQTGTGSTSYDRHIYMGNDGTVKFGWFSGSAELVSSTNTYNDDKWHSVVATFDGTTGTLYVDGVSQGTDTGSAQNYTGYWRLGGYKLQSWANAGDGYFIGNLDEIRIYSRVLNSSEIAAVSAGNPSTTTTADVNRNFTQSNGVYTAPSSNFTIAGNFTKTGGTFTHNSGTVVFDGTSGTSTLTTNGSSLNNLTLNDAGGSLTVELQDALTTGGNITITGGTLDTKSGSNFDITVGGNWDNDDTFTARSGEVIFTAGNHTISGNTTFNDFTKLSSTGLTFEAGSTTTITGTWTLHGTSALDRMTLRSSSTGVQWNIDPQGTRDIQYLDVQDSNNINSTIINAVGTSSVSQGNNTNWSFDIPDDPTNLGPAQLVDGSYTSDTTPTLTFDMSDPDLGTTLRYQIQIDDSSDFLSNVVNFTSALAAQGSFSFTVGQALSGGTYTTGSVAQTLSEGNYYWRVRAIDGGGELSSFTTANTGAIAFRVDTTAPSVPGDPSTSTPTTDKTPTWTWTDSTDLGSGLATTPYTIEWCTDSSFVGCGANSATAATSTYTHTVDLAVGTWYVRVKAADAAGNESSYSGTGSVVINASSSSSSATSDSSSSFDSSGSTPTCSTSVPTVAPSLYSVTSVGTSATLFFTTVPGEITYYYISYGIDPLASQFATTFNTNFKGTALSYTIENLAPNTTYFFKVKGANACGAGPASSIVSTSTRLSVLSSPSPSNLPSGFFSNLRVSTDNVSRVIITWNTRLLATTILDWGESQSLGTVVNDGVTKENHTVVLNGIKEGIDYYFRLSGEAEGVRYTDNAVHNFKLICLSDQESLICKVEDVERKDAVVGININERLPSKSFVANLNEEVKEIASNLFSNVPDSSRILVFSAAGYLREINSLNKIIETVAPVTFMTALIVGIKSIVDFVTNLSNIKEVFLVFYRNILGIVGVLTRRRPRHWGVVYDSVTKQPLDPAVVTLHRLDDSGVPVSEKNAITDRVGRFGFLLKPGKYVLMATKKGYKFPSQKLKGKKTDLLYESLYTGEVLDITDSTTLNISIPMDEEEIN